MANDWGMATLSGGFLLKKDVNLELEEALVALFLQWAALSVWLVQLVSSKANLHINLHELQYLVLDAMNSDGC
jgi:hypothetical protein